MPYCTQCGRRHESRRPFCPECDRQPAATAVEPSDVFPGIAPLPEVPTGETRVAVARFQNGAEAGYFADELARQAGFSCDVLTRERFDAVHAAWTVDYVLLAARDQAEEAARRLQELVDATADDDRDDAAAQADSSEISAAVWAPLIITLAAGSIACFGIERVDPRPRPAALVIGDGRKPTELWEILGASHGPWVQKVGDQGGQRRLTLDRERRTALLQEDDDGDGQVDREWEFSWRK